MQGFIDHKPLEDCCERQTHEQPARLNSVFKGKRCQRCHWNKNSREQENGPILEKKFRYWWQRLATQFISKSQLRRSNFSEGSQANPRRGENTGDEQPLDAQSPPTPFGIMPRRVGGHFRWHIGRAFYATLFAAPVFFALSSGRIFSTAASAVTPCFLRRMSTAPCSMN
jgi:hypothetical protein